MQTFDQSLFNLFQKGLITYDEALKWTTNPDEFKLKKIGLQSTKDMSLEEMERRMSEDGAPQEDVLSSLSSTLDDTIDQGLAKKPGGGMGSMGNMGFGSSSNSTKNQGFEDHNLLELEDL